MIFFTPLVSGRGSCDLGNDLQNHGETTWTTTRQHIGRTDLLLTERGEGNAQRRGERLTGLTFPKIFTSPLERARTTCELAGSGSVAQIDSDLVEWGHGEYENRLMLDISKERPDGQLFRRGCPGVESPEQVVARADRVVNRVRSVHGRVLVFSSGHLPRVLATRLIGMEPINGKSPCCQERFASRERQGEGRQLVRETARPKNHYRGAEFYAKEIKGKIQNQSSPTEVTEKSLRAKRKSKNERKLIAFRKNNEFRGQSHERQETKGSNYGITRSNPGKADSGQALSMERARLTLQQCVEAAPATTICG